MRQSTEQIFYSQDKLVKAIKDNDEAVLKSLYTVNYPKTERYVLENSGTEDEAKDVFQEAFVAVWRNIQLDKFRPENETALSGYLFQIAKFKWIDILRANKKKKIVTIDEEHTDIEQYTDPLNADQEQYLKAVKKGFQSIGESCKEMLTRFYFKKESLRVISEALGITEATARNNKYRCIQRLKSLINIK